MLLSEISYMESGLNAIDDLCIWGIEPLMEFLKIFEEQFCNNGNKRANWLCYEMTNKLSMIEKTLYKLANEMDGKRSLQDQNKNLIDILPDYKQTIIHYYLKKELNTYRKE